MSDEIFAVGSRVYVTDESAFRGLQGTISTVYPIAVESQEPWYFYLVKLEGTESEELIWFAQEEVAAALPSSRS
jgi:hypothetical protein